MNTPNQPDLPEFPRISAYLQIFSDLYDAGSSETVQLILTTIGGVVVIYGLLQVLDWVFSVLQSPRLAIYRHAGNDSWALVTGANDGIGRAFSEELLRRGFNLLLHGRNAQKLEKVKKELEKQWPKRKLDIVVADAAKYDNAYEILVKKAKSLPGKLTILVNNVGGQITFPRYIALADIEHDHIDTCMNVNARFPTHLTASMIPLLRENSPSLIINCGSMGGLISGPYLATYVSTKAYIHTFTQAVKYEMVGDGTPDVEVMGFVIGNTQTTGNPHNMPLFTLKARDCAASCLDRVGKSGGPVVFSHWLHSLQFNLTKLIPKNLESRLIMDEMRKRAKAEREEPGSAKKDL